MRRICERARQRNTDLILTGGDEAFYSLMTCGDSLPYRLPVVYSDIKYPDSALMQKASHAVGFLAEPDYRTLIEEAIRLFPQRKRLVCLSDNSHLSRCSMQRIRETWYALQPAYPDYTLIEMNVETTPLNSIISAVCFDNLAYRYTVIASKWTPFLRIRLKAPLFICHNNGLDQEPWVYTMCRLLSMPRRQADWPPGCFLNRERLHSLPSVCLISLYLITSSCATFV